MPKHRPAPHGPAQALGVGVGDAEEEAHRPLSLGTWPYAGRQPAVPQERTGASENHPETLKDRAQR